VGVAELQPAQGVAVRAALLIDADPVFRVGARTTQTGQDYRIDIVEGHVLDESAAALSGEECAGAITVAEAIASAEHAAGGEAVAIEPDDDGHCNREVKVLVGTTVWEVKVGPDGSVIEKEVDDEN